MTANPPLSYSTSEGPLRVLVVCTGNICRSPAAALLMERLQVFGVDAQFETAGLGAVVNSEIDQPMKDVLARLDDLDTSKHRARQITPAMINTADLVLTMSTSQRSHVLSMEPQALTKVLTLPELGHLMRVNGHQLKLEDLRSLANQLPDNLKLDIADPYRRGSAAMQVAVLDILRSLSMIMNRPLAAETLAVTGTQTLSVMTSARASDDRTSAYMVELMDTMTQHPAVEYQPFSWRTALTGNVDVFHSHWPEAKLEAQSLVKRWGRRIAFGLMILNFTRRKTAVVQTLHNLSPHEKQNKLNRRLIGWFRQRETLRISINSTTPHDQATPIETILHGDARNWFDAHDVVEAQLGKLSYFGLIRRYKGVEDLLQVFTSVTAPYDLTVAGNPSPAELADELTELARADTRIDLQLGHIPDPELAKLISSSTLIVLPYRRLHNSGAAITALSLNRPILVPANESTNALAVEVGEEWVLRFEGKLTADVITHAMQAAEKILQSGQKPDLSLRSWTLAGDQHAAVFAEAKLRAALGQFRKSVSA